MEDIPKIEDLELFTTIVLHGKVEYCKTHDECDSTIGVKEYAKARTLSGKTIDKCISEFPLTQRMEEDYSWTGKYASVRMLTGDTPIDLDNLDETYIVSMMGEVDSRYYHCYSDYTGYLWTEEDFKVGGHNLVFILQSHLGEYIHLEIELYKRKKSNARQR